MRIAQVSPLFESVPPKLYGGTERVVSYLTEALLDLGHEVTLFASGDSVTNASLVSVTPKALRLGKSIDPYALHILQLQHVVEMAGQFDIIHFHTDYLHFPVSRMSAYNHVTTLHGRLDIPELSPLYSKFCDMPVVSISFSQRAPLPQANFIGNVYHGMPKGSYQFCNGSGEYAVFIGRFSPEKGADRAIEIAAKAGIPLKIAAKVDKGDEDYFNAHIRPLLNQPHVEYLGEVGEDKKNELLGNAKVMLFPIAWPEPFGIVMIESLACGTPVIAFNNGSVPEIISDGETGFVVSSIDEAVEAVGKIETLDRKSCRKAFIERFESKRMAMDYLHVYRMLIEENKQIRLPKTEKGNGNVLSNILSA